MHGSEHSCGRILAILLITLVLVQPCAMALDGLTDSGNRSAQSIDNAMPWPAESTGSEGSLVVPASFSYSLSGPGSAALERLQRALDRFAASTHTSLGQGEPALLSVTVASPGSTYPRLDTDESYRLHVEPAGIRIDAATPYGAIHGLTTLGQLMHASRTVNCVTVNDHPRYRWRGLLLDVVRHWMSLDVVKRQIDAMSLYKMNVLHWHLSNDQSFRVESTGHPELHLEGSDGQYYSQAQVRELVEYAADRGVRVVPEFDLPGHSRSWQIAYPQLSSVPGKTYFLYHQDGLFSDPMDPTRTENLALVANIVQEMSALFPDDYFHMGGDEVDMTAWEDSQPIQQFIEDNGLEDEHGLQQWFMARYAEIVMSLGKVPIGWDEIADGKLAPEVVVNKWLKLEYSEAEKQNPIVLSAGFYLDHMQTAWRHYRNDPSTLPNAAGAQVLGGEASAWAESIDQYTIDMRVWPRTLAIAELLWSPASITDSVTEPQLYRRLDIHSKRLEAVGLQHLRHTQAWFEQLLGPDNARPLIALASVSRAEPFAGLLTALPRFYRFPWDKTLYDEPLPLSVFFDHIPPESLEARRFNLAVERYLRTRRATDRDEVREQLQAWSDNHPALLLSIEGSAQLQDAGVAELSAELKQLADAGLAALAALEAGTTLSGSRYQDVVDENAFMDPELSLAWFRAEVLKPRNLFRPLILVQVKLPVQRGIALLVQAAS
jgi:hexosaminidase